MLKSYFIQFCTLFSVLQLVSSQLKEVTQQIFPNSVCVGFLGAYGDINGDKHTDLFVIEDGNKVKVLLGSSENLASFSHLQTVTCNNSNKIDAIFPADYNSDTFLDVIISFSDGQAVSLVILFGTSNGMLSSNCVLLPQKFISQPTLLDSNADMIPDLFVAYTNNTKQFLLGHKSHTSSTWDFAKQSFSVTNDLSSKLDDLFTTYSNAFTDVTGDGQAELVLSVRDNNKLSYEAWQSSNIGLKRLWLRAPPENFEIGQSLFVDFDGDSVQDHLLPVCEVRAGRCTSSKILMFKDGKWEEIFNGGEQVNFVSQEISIANGLITLVPGDFNQDTFVDILCIVQQSNDSNIQPVAGILYGQTCRSKFCSAVGRQLSFALVVPNSQDAFSASFFDLAYDGTLDVLVSIAKTVDNGVSYSVRAYENTEAQDASFLLVKVMSGNTSADTNVAGISVTYTTTDANGHLQKSGAMQLSQSSHLSLQLPYVIFGLGRLPNFVDSIEVTLPPCLLPLQQCADPKNNGSRTSKTWSMLIPNSQLFVIPSPPSNPTSWTNQLLVTPGRNLVTTLAVLLTICAAIFIAIVTLHCVERRQDLREKIEEAHRFHFDAM